MPNPVSNVDEDSLYCFYETACMSGGSLQQYPLFVHTLSGVRSVLKVTGGNVSFTITYNIFEHSLCLLVIPVFVSRNTEETEGGRNFSACHEREDILSVPCPWALKVVRMVHSKA